MGNIKLLKTEQDRCQVDAWTRCESGGITGYDPMLLNRVCPPYVGLVGDAVLGREPIGIQGPPVGLRDHTVFDGWGNPLSRWVIGWVGGGYTEKSVLGLI